MSERIKIKFKKIHPEAKEPTRQRWGDAGYDLTSISEKVRLEPTGPYVEYDTGIAVEIPEGWAGFIFPRSSITTKTSLMLGNCVGVIDSNYRGSIKAQFRNVNQMGGKKYNVGDNIMQMIILPIPNVSWEEVDILSETERGDQGFGSSDTI